MSNPLRRLLRLPWLSLMITALLTNILVFVLEFFLWFGAVRYAGVQDALNLLFSPPLGLIIVIAIGVGVGAIAVLLLEIIYPYLVIETGMLWGLVPCLLLTILLKSIVLQQLSLPTSLVSLNEMQLLGMILGIFTKGRSYWRY